MNNSMMIREHSCKFVVKRFFPVFYKVLEKRGFSSDWRLR